MERFLPRWICLFLIASFTAGLSGCGGVREDRTIVWSPAGDSVFFQHGRDGLFVWNEKQGQAELIYQPPTEVIATSTPLWSPDGNRLVFLTATLDQKGAVSPLEAHFEFQDADWDANPEGRLFNPLPAIYQCWLCERDEDHHWSQPRELFHARCRHVGMVAANIALRWHPSGNSLFYINRTNTDTHQVLEFDLEEGHSSAALPFEAENLIFDWSPSGKQMASVIQNTGTPNTNGIWIGSPEEGDWWQVPFSQHVLQGTTADSLPRLQGLRPVWSRNGEQFAFVGPAVRDRQIQQATAALYVGDLESREVRELYAVQGTIQHVHWAPDGQSVGYLIDTETLRGLRSSLSRNVVSDLLVVQEISQPQPVAVTLRPVRAFAGWNALGTSLAYTVPSPVGPQAHIEWAFLLSPRGGGSRPGDRSRLLRSSLRTRNAERHAGDISQLVPAQRSAFLVGDL